MRLLAEASWSVDVISLSTSHSKALSLFVQMNLNLLALAIINKLRHGYLFNYLDAVLLVAQMAFLSAAKLNVR